jgi:exopolysaccharide production protein ExoY
MTNSEMVSSTGEQFQFNDYCDSSEEILIQQNAYKRLFDIVFSFAVLICGFPLFLCISLAILLTSKGNVIFAQERVGRGGKSFKFYKFRTMIGSAEQELSEILASNPALQSEWDISQKLKNDPRITKIGSFLRKTSLDELPQFWNVLIGDLSVVGPRPFLKEQVEQHLGEKAAKILSVRPGLTGIWQTSGRNHTTFLQRITMEEMYVEQTSFLLDLKLILKTIPCVVLGKGAY